MRRAIHLGLSLALIASAGAALAQQGVSIDSIQQAAQGDRSLKMLTDIFGDFANHPFSGGNSPMAAAFSMLNAAALVIGIWWFTYTIGAGIVQTAHDGEFLGKRYSSVWLPIRFSIGIGALVPIFGGFSLAQAFMMWGATTGIGIANLTTTAVVTKILDGKSMVAQPHAQPPIDAVESVFRSAACVASVNHSIREAAKPNQPNAEEMMHLTQTGPTSYAFGAPAKNGGSPGVECGAVSITQVVPNMSNRAPENDAVSEPLRLAHQSAFLAMVDETNEAAQSYVLDNLAYEIEGVGARRSIPTNRLNEIAAAYEHKINRAVASNFRKITGADSKLFAKIEKEGWSTLGVWYQTFASVNERLASAAAISIEARPPAQEKMVFSNDRYWTALRSRLNDPAEREISRAEVNDAFNTSSMGQWIIEKVIKGINWTASSNGSGDIANPIIVGKNVGDSVLITGEAVLGGYTAGIIGGETWGKLPIIGAVPDSVKEVLKGLSWIFMLASITLFFFGGMLSTYLPMLPFILWFGALLSWIAIVAEAVIAGPLWAMMHLDGEGDGMGQRTGHGYLFLLNVIFRPVLMVLGFFIASLIVIVMGQYLNDTYFAAVANAQNTGSNGSSWTGLVSIIFYLAIYTGLLMTLVFGAFNLIHVVPDQVLGWLGGHLGATLGRDTEQGTKQVFGGVGHSGGSSTGQEVSGMRRDRAGMQRHGGQEHAATLREGKKRFSPGDL